MKDDVRYMESRIAQTNKYIEATREYLPQKNPFMEGGYSSYNPDTGLPKTKVDGETIGKSLTKKATKKKQTFNKKHENFKKNEPNGDIYNHLENI